MKILLIDDDELDRALFEQTFQDAFPAGELVQCEDTEDLHSLAEAHRPDCILLDYRLRGNDGLSLLRNFSFSSDADARPPVIMLTGEGNEAVAVRALKLGGADYLSKNDMTAAALQTAISDAISDMQQRQVSQAEQRRLRELATTDSLTQAGNRLAFTQALERKLSLASRHGAAFAVLLIDLDQFKPINDEYGHHAGDVVLIETVRRLRDTIRTEDGVFRLGGDEFTVILDLCPSAGDAAEVRERILQALTEPHCLPSGVSLMCGASVGMAIYPRDGDNAHALTHAADAAMYRCKRTQQRDRVAGPGPQDD